MILLFSSVYYVRILPYSSIFYEAFVGCLFNNSIYGPRPISRSTHYQWYWTGYTGATGPWCSNQIGTGGEGERGGGGTRAAARRLWGIGSSDRVTGSRVPAEGEQEGWPQNNLLFVGRVLVIRMVIQGKGVGRGGGSRQTGQGNPRVKRKSKIIGSKKSKILEGVAVYGWDTPHPPPNTPKYYQLHRLRCDISSAGSARPGQGQPSKHQLGEDSEGWL